MLLVRLDAQPVPAALPVQLAVPDTRYRAQPAFQSVRIPIVPVAQRRLSVRNVKRASFLTLLAQLARHVRPVAQVAQVRPTTAFHVAQGITSLVPLVLRAIPVVALAQVLLNVQAAFLAINPMERIALRFV